MVEDEFDVVVVLMSVELCYLFFGYGYLVLLGGVMLDWRVGGMIISGLGLG